MVTFLPVKILAARRQAKTHRFGQKIFCFCAVDSLVRLRSFGNASKVSRTPFAKVDQRAAVT